MEPIQLSLRANCYKSCVIKKITLKKNKKMKQQKLEFNFLIFRTAFGQYPDGSDFRRKKKNLIDLIA